MHMISLKNIEHMQNTEHMQFCHGLLTKWTLLP